METLGKKFRNPNPSYGIVPDIVVGYYSWVRDMVAPSSTTHLWLVVLLLLLAYGWHNYYGSLHMEGTSRL